MAHITDYKGFKWNPYGVENLPFDPKHATTFGTEVIDLGKEQLRIHNTGRLPVRFALSVKEGLGMELAEREKRLASVWNQPDVALAMERFKDEYEILHARIFESEKEQAVLDVQRRELQEAGEVTDEYLAKRAAQVNFVIPEAHARQRYLYSMMFDGLVYVAEELQNGFDPVDLCR